jgi:hypothetical protein
VDQFAFLERFYQHVITTVVDHFFPKVIVDNTANQDDASAVSVRGELPDCRTPVG